MAGSTSGTTAGTASSNSAASPIPPKILLAKPGLVTGTPVVATTFGRGGSAGEDDAASLRSRVPPIGSLNLLSDSWDFHIDRFLPFLTENTEFTVIGVIGPPGVGKSTIMNELYGFDPSSPGMLPPYSIQWDETGAMARHTSYGIEPRVSVERLILLDTQPVFSASVLAEMIRPDGSSTIQVLSGESLSAELSHEVMGIQLGVLLMSICHIVLVVSEGVHDLKMWRLMSTVDLLNHDIPDPSTLHSSSSQSFNPDKDGKVKVREGGEYMATPVFVHTKLQDQDIAPFNVLHLKKALGLYFGTCFMKDKHGNAVIEERSSAEPGCQSDKDYQVPRLFVIPKKSNCDSLRDQYETYTCMLWKLRDEVLSSNGHLFARTLSEREWLKNSAKIWELVKNSVIVAEYAKTLQSSGLFRR